MQHAGYYSLEKRSEMIEYKFEENESLYYQHAEQFVSDCKIFDRLPTIKKYAIRYADDLKLETGPFWKTVKRVLKDRGGE
jgi:hypothetical protein